MKKARDGFLDALRGVAMFEVVFVHILYWTGIFAGGKIAVAKSFLLFEMPLLFFVTGGANAVKSGIFENGFSLKEYFLFVKKRFLRVLVPYWIYAAFAIALNFLYLAWRGELASQMTGGGI